jgi:fibronectin type 3 domain-containing protein
MFLSSICLYINGLPVDYNISIENENFLFEPVFNPHPDLPVPQFAVTYNKGDFHFAHMDDIDLRAQVEEIIKEYLADNN